MNLIAIGGGSVGKSTLPMDQELARLAAKSNPKVLFIPTASDDSQEYVDTVFEAYRALGCPVDVLRLWDQSADAEESAAKISAADVVYVGGGNTKKMLEKWRSVGVDKLLRVHLDAGKPAGGVSAGAICWSKIGNSDWPQYEQIPNLNTARLDCLGFVDLVLCPHTRDEPFRLGDFREMMRDISGPGVGIDDNAAIQISGDTYRVLASEADAVAHRIEWIDGELRERILPPHGDFRPLQEIASSASSARSLPHEPVTS